MKTKRQKIMVGNWKMNGASEVNKVLIQALVTAVQPSIAAQVAICPPSIYLQQAKDLIDGSGICVGAQNVSGQQVGAYTGETSASMLCDLGCSYVIVGHSERRAMQGESDAQLAQKINRSSEQGLTSILCVGESLQEREQTLYAKVIERQISAIIEVLGIDAFNDIIIAYELVWAIGTGLTATPAQVQEIHRLIRQIIAHHNVSIAAKMQILYGGSMNEKNAQSLLELTDVDGGLVGGAALASQKLAFMCNLLSVYNSDQ